MCGIAGIYLKPGAKISDSRLQAFSNNLLRGINHRGGDATGFVAQDDVGNVLLEKAACNVEDFLREARHLPKNTRVVLLHTRWATQGDKGFMSNNHPIQKDNYYVIHNGHISNDDTVIAKFGLERIGRVDSEAIAHAFRAKGFAQAESAIESLKGTAAIAVLDTDSRELLLARAASSPIVVCETNSMIVWASEITAITAAWKSALGTPPVLKAFHYLPEGMLIHYKPDGSNDERRFDPIDYFSGGGYFTGAYSNDNWENDQDFDYGPWKPETVAGKTIYTRQKTKKTPGKFTTSERKAYNRSINIPGQGTVSRCMMCDELVPTIEVYEVYEDFFCCEECQDFLVDEAVEAREKAAAGSEDIRGITDRLSSSSTTHINGVPFQNERGDLIDIALKQLPAGVSDDETLARVTVSSLTV